MKRCQREQPVHGRSHVAFVSARSGDAVDALREAHITNSSRGLGWSDVHVEVGRNGQWEVDDIATPWHYLALNTEAAPLVFEAKVGGVFRRTVLQPGEAWFCPAGEAFSHRVDQEAGFALVTLAPSKLLRVLEEPAIALRRTYSVASPQLEHIVLALAAEAQRGGPSGAGFVEALTVALSIQLGASFGTRSAAAAGCRAPIPPRALRRVLDFVDDHLGEAISVEQLAGVAGVGVARFARGFRAAMDEAPHQHVMRRRLEAAKTALDAADPDILNVALRYGFSDQAHFTRLFGRRYETTPCRYVQSRRR